MWHPHVTVATVICKDNRFLMVKEMSLDKLVYNQPAGHLEDGETLLEAATRETLEETCWNTNFVHYLGVSQYLAPNMATYIRHSFVALALSLNELQIRDSDILDIEWLSYEQLLIKKDSLRSPLVMNDIKRYRRQAFLPLDTIQDFTYTS
jgi:ADP-ribose pyrophosphatase YjhB (NUDIX family)